MRRAPVLGLALLLLGGCATTPSGGSRDATVLPAAAPPVAAAAPADPRARHARFTPDDPSCQPVACAGRVLVSQVWDLVRR